MRKLLISMLLVGLISDSFAIGFGGRFGGGFRSGGFRSSPVRSSYGRSYSHSSSGYSANHLLTTIVILSLLNNNSHATVKAMEENDLTYINSVKSAKTKDKCVANIGDDEYKVSYNDKKHLCYVFHTEE
jgi:hypothetical protein